MLGTISVNIYQEIRGILAATINDKNAGSKGYNESFVKGVIIEANMLFSKDVPQRKAVMVIHSRVIREI